MSDLKRKYIKNAIAYDKSDIAAVLGVEYHVLNRFLPDAIKQNAGWKSGRQYFNDLEAVAIIKGVRPLWSQDVIIDKLYTQKAQKTAF